MKFSAWLERRLTESLNPELDKLRRDEKLLLMSIEGRKDPMGRVLGVNAAGYVGAVRDLKELRAKIKEIEAKADKKDEPKPLPAWMQSRKAV